MSMWRSGDNFQEVTSPLLRVGLGVLAQLVRLGGECLCPVSQLVPPALGRDFITGSYNNSLRICHLKYSIVMPHRNKIKPSMSFLL